MDFEDTPEEAAFRARARAFLERHLEPRPRGARRTPPEPETPEQLERAAAWQARLCDEGFGCLTWPREFGGQEAPPVLQAIWNQEESRFRTPPNLFAIQLGNLAPTLMLWGTDAQKRTHLRRMGRGDDVWCQLFSEPGAGSDLAGLRTRASRDGDGWVVDGQKIWTSNAQHARFGMLVARTDPSVPKHHGLTYFIVDMKAAGVGVKPIRTMDDSSHFCEVFFDGVRVPDDARIGGVGDGWRVSVTTLMNERTMVGGYETPSIEHLLAVASALPDGRGGSVLQNGAVRERIADFWVTSRGLQLTMFRAHTALSQGREPGPENSIVKLVAARLTQEIHALGMEIRGAAGVLATPGDGAGALGYLRAPGGRLAGGTDEILRNILAERVLGLPPEPRTDKGVPFDRVPAGSRDGSASRPTRAD